MSGLLALRTFFGTDGNFLALAIPMQIAVNYHSLPTLGSGFEIRRKRDRLKDKHAPSAEEKQRMAQDNGSSTEYTERAENREAHSQPKWLTQD